MIFRILALAVMVSAIGCVTTSTARSCRCHMDADGRSCEIEHSEETFDQRPSESSLGMGLGAVAAP